jgi:cytochrome c oxidase assembly protein subunit 15
MSGPPRDRAPLSCIRVLAKATGTATLLLIFVGSLVTSTGSGLAVPDWPLSYGGLFPPLVGGILYEHGHRVAATLVGILVLLQAILLGVREPRRWVRVLGFGALAAILAQGLLGGLTVLFLLPTAVSVAHALLAQALFAVTIGIAYALSRERGRRVDASTLPDRVQEDPRMARWLWLLLGVVYLQLVLGALMRHTDAGLAIPDFPLLGGQVIPRFDAEMLGHIAADRSARGWQPVVLTQVVVHALHRGGALLTLLVAGLANYAAQRAPRIRWEIRRVLTWINWLLLLQIGLGAATVLTGKVPLLASLHVVVGASILGGCVFGLLRALPVRLTAARAAATR